MQELDKEKTFENAVLFIRNGTTTDVSKTLKLQYYALYKQAEVGPCSLHGGEQPSYFNYIDRMKWGVWNNLEEMSSTTAKQRYIEMLNEYNPNWNKIKLKSIL